MGIEAEDDIDVEPAHSDAMSFADVADELYREGDLELAKLAYSGACICETKAANALKRQGGPGRMVATLFRSAAALAMYAEQYDDALRLAKHGLTFSDDAYTVQELDRVVELVHEKLENGDGDGSTK